MSRGRPPYPDVLTPSEIRVLELIRQGKTNSEIANELAISVSGVKYHVTNMLGKLGVEGRQGLASWDGPAKDKSNTGEHKAWLAPLIQIKFLAGAAGIAVATSVVAIAVSAGGGDDLAASQSSPTATEALAAVPPSAPEFLAMGMVDAGPLLISLAGSPPVASSDIRDTLTIARLTGPALILEGSGQRWSLNSLAVVPNATFLVGVFNNQQFSVDLFAENTALSESTVITTNAQGALEIGSKLLPAAPEILVAVRRSDTGVPHPAAIAENGHLYIAKEPLAQSLVVDEWTGAILDVTTAAKLAPLAAPARGLFQFTGCEPEKDTCYVSVRTDQPLRAQVAGTLRCLSANQLELEHADFKLLIRQVDTGYGSSPQFSCDQTSVAVGDEIGPRANHWIYEARATNGGYLSVGVARDGSLYVGRFSPAVGCPCRSGN